MEGRQEEPRIRQEKISTRHTAGKPFLQKMDQVIEVPALLKCFGARKDREIRLALDEHDRECGVYVVELPGELVTVQVP